jgi:hypothetical protein
MALYHHVENKAALVALMAEAAINENPLPPPSTDGWKQGLLDLARWTREQMFAHPAMATLQVEHRVWTPSALAVGEQWMGLWQRSGLSHEAAVQAGVLSSLTALGLMREQAFILNDFTPPDEKDLAFVPNARAMYGASLDPIASFDLVVLALIDGLHAQLSAQEKTTAETQRRSRRTA